MSSEFQPSTGESVSRRGFFHGLSIATAMTAGAAAIEAQEHAHHEVAAEKKASGAYTPRFFNPHEMKTMRRLAELVVPADEGGPSAAEASAHEFIDLICSKSDEIANAYSGGILWLDGEMGRRFGKPFVESSAAQQTEVLDLIAYRKNATPAIQPGVDFFDLARRMIVDGYYTSREGFRDIGYLGNKATRKWDVPAASIEYALKAEKAR